MALVKFPDILSELVHTSEPLILYLTIKVLSAPPSYPGSHNTNIVWKDVCLTVTLEGASGAPVRK